MLSRVSDCLPLLQVIAETPHVNTQSVGSIALLERALRRRYEGSEADSGFVAGVLYVGTVHSVKGAEADTVFVAEPGTLMMAKNLAKGGDAAQDEKNVYHVAVSRARENLFYMANVYYKHGLAGVRQLFAGELPVDADEDELSDVEED